MKPTPEKLDMIIKMARRCASPLPWEVDINRANETIFELWTALEGLLLMTDRGSPPRKLDEALTWRHNDELARSMGYKALANAKKMEAPHD